ncbi:unnamed protein product [Clavelina lepadiformis]|uniref:Uncharacterized protein n=1 Tax=Clavelina lepadiformis TaxID=159417 RepID=A0ABP0GR72_CLALP
MKGENIKKKHDAHRWSEMKQKPSVSFENNVTPDVKVYFGSNLSPSMKGEDILKKTAFDGVFSLEEANRVLKRCYKML